MDKTRCVAFFIACSLSALLIPSLASSEPLIYKQLDRWSVIVEPASGYGCGLFLGSDKGSFYLIFENDNKTALINMHHRNWSSIENNKQYDVALQFDSEKRLGPWSFTSKAVRGNMYINGRFGYQQEYSIFNFIDDLHFSDSLDLYYSDDKIASFSLKESKSAVRELVRCQKPAMESDGIPGNNPFSGSNDSPSSRFTIID